MRMTASDARRLALAAQRIVRAPPPKRNGILQLIREVRWLRAES